MVKKLPLGTRVLQKAAETLDLPSDMVAGAPRITMIGRTEVQIYHHTGLMQYGEQQLLFGTRRGTVLVQGDSLRLRAMNRDEVYIVGQIDGVSYLQEDEGDA